MINRDSEIYRLEVKYYPMGEGVPHSSHDPPSVCHCIYVSIINFKLFVCNVIIYISEKVIGKSLQIYTFLSE